MNWKTDNLDERQLRIRGHIYIRAFLLALVLLVLNTFLLERGLVFSRPRYATIAVIYSSIAWLWYEQLARGIFPLSEKVQRVTVAVAAAISLVAIAICLYNARALGLPLAQNGALAENGFFLCAALLYLPPFFIYHHWRRRDRLAANETE